MYALFLVQIFAIYNVFEQNFCKKKGEKGMDPNCGKLRVRWKGRVAILQQCKTYTVNDKMR